MSTKFWTELRDPRMLQKLMERKGYNDRDLAEILAIKLRRAKVRYGFRKSTICNLRTGVAKTVNPVVAQAIADVFDMDRDILFIDRLSDYSSSIGRTRRSAAV